MDLKVIAYSKTDIKEEDNCSVADAKKLLDKYETVWLDFDGKLNKKTRDSLNELFNIHPLALEDCMDENQRSKVESYDDFLIIIMKSVEIHGDEIITQRYNIFLGEKFIITITEKESRLLETIRERIRKKKPMILKLGSDHLCYVIIDAIVDSFFPLLEDIGETIEELEDKALEDPETPILEKIHDYKRMLIMIRKVLWPQREFISSLYKGEIKDLDKQTRFGLRDVSDHMVQIIEIVESQRDVLSGIMDLYQSAITNKMNEIMKVLTIIATIFIPLTFITGLYGMNFDFMPVLSYEYGYLSVVIMMLVLAIIMIGFFKKKNWL